MISTEHPRPRHTFLHITDTHLPGEPGLLYGAADADAHLAQLLAAVEASGVRPDALLMAGDLTDRGDVPAYRRLRELVLPVAERIGAEVVWAPGNHDERGAFRGELLGETAATDPICFVRWFGGMRVLVVDSTVPGEHWGALAEGQLTWLREQLATPAPEGSLIVMHHPPLPTVLDLAVTVELRDQAALAEVLRGSDVRSILSGHVHHPSFGTFAGIPVAVATSTAYSQDLAVGLGGTRGQDGAQGLNVVHVYDDTIVHSPLTIGAYPTVGEHVPAVTAAARIEAQGIRWRDA